jgi:hypothetical protein
MISGKASHADSANWRLLYETTCTVAHFVTVPPMTIADKDLGARTTVTDVYEMSA